VYGASGSERAAATDPVVAPAVTCLDDMRIAGRFVLALWPAKRKTRRAHLWLTRFPSASIIERANRQLSGSPMPASLLPRALLTAAIALLTCAAQGASNGELAQQCRDQVAKLYRDTWPKGVTDDGNSRVRFDSHYNSRLGKCIFLETVSGVTRSPALKRILPRETQRLGEAGENHNLGKFDRWNDEVPVTCWVQEKKCGSKQEWEQLIRPYFEE